MQIVFVALAQLAGDHGLSFAHVINRALNRDNALEIKAVNVVDAAHGDLCIRVLHDSFDGVSALPDNSANKIVVREDLQSDFTVDKQRNNVINIQLPTK